MESFVIDSQRLVHLDFKGAAPKLQYLEKLFPLLRDLGATGLLIEWEDTFPYSKELISIGSLSPKSQSLGLPYTIEDVSQMLLLAADCGLNVVPLVQTIGHLEFVLKNNEWRKLREVEAYPSSMCPSHPDAQFLVHNMIKQIISLHPDLQFIHIGADEVWHMGLCSVCERRTLENKNGKAGLFLEHVVGVAQYIKEFYPTLKIIIWDDMLRNIDATVLFEYNIGSLVEPMIWHYNNSETFQLNSAMWEKYCSIFPNIWAASAFKGATGSCQILPLNQYHVSNHEAWLTELSVYSPKMQCFRGIVFTGWSRYDHYATLCELLPCSIPTLAVCLKIWLSGGYSSHILNSVGKILGYSIPLLSVEQLTRFCQPIPELKFPGWQVLVGIEWLLNIKNKYKNIVDSDQLQTWFNTWQVRHNYTNPMQIENLLPILKSLLSEVVSLEGFLRVQLDANFYPITGDELIGTHLYSIQKHLKFLQADCEAQLSQGCQPCPTQTRVLHH